MRLQAQIPTWMLLAIVYRANRILVTFWTVHWLQVEMPKREMLERRRLRALLDLWEDQFQFITG